MKLLDRTGTGLKTAGVVGLVLLVATVLWLPDPEPEPAQAPAAVAPEPPPPPQEDPLRLRESSRVRRMVPVYPGATFTPMGLMEANGNMMEMGFFEAKASVREVLDFYTTEFGRRGHVVEQPGANGDAALNYYDAGSGLLVSVTVTPTGTEREPKALVFPSVTAAPDGVFLKAQAVDRLPQPDGVVTVMRVDDKSTGPSQGSTTMTQVARGTPQQLSEYYRREMTARGYSAFEKRTSGTSEILGFERPGERVSMTLSPVTKDGAAESVVAVVVENTSDKKGM